MQSKFTYVGIRVADLERSIEFYTKLLGMRVQGRGKNEQTKGETVDLESAKDRPCSVLYRCISEIGRLTLSSQTLRLLV